MNNKDEYGDEIKMPELTHEMLKKVFMGEAVELLPAPGKGYCYDILSDGTVIKKKVCKDIYE